MAFCSIRRYGLAFILTLVICQVLDYATSDTLSFIDINLPDQMGIFVHFEDVIALLVTVALILCLIMYFFSTQENVYRAVLITTLLSLLVLILNAADLLRSLFDQQVNAVYLLLDASIVYVTTILLFSVFYWVLDHESQEARCSNRPYTSVLVFPQNETDYPGYEDWKPGFIDYLYLSFNTSSTFGPTETLVLSPKAKCTMISQVALSLIVLIVLAARAVGILH